jgi:hypothetical protein
MKRTRDLSSYEQEQRFNWMVGPLCTFLAVFALAISIDAISIDDVNTADENTHVGSIPAGVTLLSKDSYLLARSTDATPLGICKGGDGTDDGVKETRRIPDLNSTFIKCYGDQNWNFKPARDNPGLFDGYSIAAQKQEFQLVAAIGLGLTLIFPLLVALVNSFGAVKDRVHARRDRKVIYNKQLAQYRALQSSWQR